MPLLRLAVYLAAVATLLFAPAVPAPPRTATFAAPPPTAPAPADTPSPVRLTLAALLIAAAAADLRRRVPWR